MWQLRQAILPASPIAPNCPSCGVPVCMGPDRRGSKNNSCPSSAAAAESRYLFVVSIGRSGNGESVSITARSAGEKMSLSIADCAAGFVAAEAPPGAPPFIDHPDNRPNTTRTENAYFIGFLRPGKTTTYKGGWMLNSTSFAFWESFAVWLGTAGHWWHCVWPEQLVSPRRCATRESISRFSL